MATATVYTLRRLALRIQALTARNATCNTRSLTASPPGVLQGDARALAMPIAAVVLTTVTAIVIRRRLTRAYRTTLDDTPSDDNRDRRL